MPIDPIKIPQNVYIEDRIVGPVTLKQIIISAIGGGISYALYSSIAKIYGTISVPMVILVSLPAIIALAFAFVRVNDLSMLHLLLLTLERASKPNVRTWAPRRGIVINIHTFTTPQEDAKRPQGAQNEKHPEHIHALSAILDQQPMHAPLSPLEEQIPQEPPVQEPAPAARPVDASRIKATPLRADADMDIAAVPPAGGTISIFRDISPRP